MPTVNFKGNKVSVSGDLPEIGAKAPDFKLTAVDLSDHSVKDFLGSKVVINIFPSVDTGVCAASVRHFNQIITSMENTIVLCVSKDLPFAQQRFCGANGIEKVTMLSEMRGDNFGTDYGVKITDSALAGLFARAVVVLNEEGRVVYTQLVDEITEEPNYDSVLYAVNKA